MDDAKNKNCFMRSLEAAFKKASILYLLTFLFTVTFLVYANSFFNQFVFDDEDFVYKNEYVKSLQFFPKYFSQNLIAGAGKVSNYYRPVLLITFALENKLFGLSPFFYHFDSTLLHAGSSILVFLVLNRLFANKFLSFFSAFLFAIHPIQTEAVTYISGRGDPLSLFFTLLAIYLYLNFSAKNYFWAIGFFVLSLLSKEIALIAPGLITIAHLVYLKKLDKENILKIFTRTLPFFALSFFYFFLRLTVLNFQNTLNFYNQSNIYTQNLFVRLVTFFKLLPSYLYLLINPVNLHMERDTRIFTKPDFLSISIIAIILILTIISIRYFRKVPFLFFSLFWFFIGFMPTSGIIPINGIFYEHFLYFPSIGFFTLVSYLIYLMFTRSNNVLKSFLIASIAIYVIILGVRTIARNRQWADPVSFYASMLKYTESARARNNLAMYYAENGKIDEAIQEYKIAISLSDTYSESHHNLANAYLALEKWDMAEKEYKQAIILDQYFYPAYFKLFLLYKETDNKNSLEKIAREIEDLAKTDNNFKALLLTINKIK